MRLIKMQMKLNINGYIITVPKENNIQNSKAYFYRCIKSNGTKKQLNVKLFIFINEK